MSSRNVDDLVRKYLKMKGLVDAIKILDSSTQIQQTHISKDDIVDLASEMNGLTAADTILNHSISNVENGKESENKSLLVNNTDISFRNDELYILCEDIILDVIHGSNQEYILETYNIFRLWCCDSLDYVKPELLMLCFPVFVYSYICLVRKNWLNESMEFWNSNIKLPPDLTLFYTTELHELSHLVSPDQLKDADFLQANTFIKNAFENKFFVKISRLSYQLVKTYIQQNDLIYLASLLNEKVLFHLYDSDNKLITDIPVHNRVSATNEAPLLRLQGYNGHDGFSLMREFSDPSSGSTITNDLNDGLLPLSSSVHNSQISLLPPIDNLPVPGRRLLHIESIEDPPINLSTWIDDKIISDVLSTMVKPKILKKRKILAATPSDKTTSESNQTTSSFEKNQASTSSTTNHAPISSTSFLNNEWLQKPFSKKSVGNSLQPSVLFMTLANSYNEVVCIDINAEITQVVAGYHDHAVRVYDVMSRGTSSSATKSDTHPLRSPYLRHDYTEVIPKDLKSLESYLQKLKQELKSNPNSSSYVKPISFDRSSSSNLKSDTELREFFGHSKPVYGVSQHANGCTIVSGSADTTARLWDIKLNQCVAKFQCTSAIWDVKFNPLFDYYFSTSQQDSNAFVFDIINLKPLRIFHGHTSDVTCSAWSDNGLVMGTGSDDHTCRLWDIRDGRCVRVFTGINSSVSSTSISKDGRILASGTDSGMIYVYDMYTSTLLGILNGHQNMVTSVSFSQDSVALYSGGLDHTIRVWNVNELIKNFSSSSSVNCTAHEIENIIENGCGVSNQITDDSVSNSYQNSFQLRKNHDETTRLNYHDMLPTNANILSPHAVYRTKYTPVYYVGVSELNLVYSGGPFSNEPI